MVAATLDLPLITAALKPLPLAGAVAVALLLFFRRRHLEPTLLIGGVIAVIALLVFGAGVVEIPNVKTIIEDLSSTLGKWTYLLVGVMAFLETGAFVGLVAPGESFMLLGGVVAGQGKVALIPLIAIGWSCAVLGDVVSFVAGQRLGRAFLEKHGRKVSITPERIAVVDAFFDKHGGKAILLGRFMGLVRAVNPFLAGSSGMPLLRFLPYSVLGAGIWASMLLVLGYVFWQSIDKVIEYAHQGTIALGSTIAVVVGLFWLYRTLMDQERRDRLKSRINAILDKPAMRPVAAVLRPAWRVSTVPRRFLIGRVTPGDLGLEVTTLLAIVAVGSFVFFGYGIELSDTPYTHGDSVAFKIADGLRAGWLNAVAEGVTYLGSSWVVIPLIVITLAVALRRGHRYEAGALLAGAVLDFVATQISKEIYDRPRPAESVVGTIGDSYPSGHASHSIVWIAVAVVLARSLAGTARPLALIVVGIAIAGVIGVTRIYLRAHYLSDVLGGWGMGAVIYGLCALVAVVALWLRQNGNASDRARPRQEPQ